MKKILTAIFVICAGVVFASPVEFVDKGKGKKKFKLNRRAKHPAGINLYIAGPAGIAGASFDYFITPKFSLEAGAGIRDFRFEPEEVNPAFFFGGRYHFLGKTPINTTPYIGVFSGFEHTGNDLRNFNLYIPVGIQRIKKNKVSWSIEVAYQRNSYQPGKRFYGGGKIGFRF